MRKQVPSADYVQISWVVHDLHKAMEKWLAQTGTGPFFVMKEIRPDPVYYRGQPAELVFNVAMAQAGPIQIELIEQINDGPSAYRDSFEKGQEGLHHLAVIAPEYEREMDIYRHLGFASATEGVFGDLRYSYVDTRTGPTGCMIEVIEETDGIKQLFRTVAEAAQNWDGKNPVRHL